MRAPPTVDELVEGATSPSVFLTSMYASAWVVRETVAPAWSQTPIAVGLVLAPVAVVVLLARRAGVELERGRCRARTDTGDRCRRETKPAWDLCWQHSRLSDVEMVDDVEDAAAADPSKET